MKQKWKNWITKLSIRNEKLKKFDEKFMMQKLRGIARPEKMWKYIRKKQAGYIAQNVERL